MTPHRPLMVIGTRPEAIKMAPVVLACRARSHEIEPIICFTGQHEELATGPAAYFGIRADFSLAAMRPGKSLAELLATCVSGLDDVIVRSNATCVVAQGDTSSVLASAIAAFYRRLPLVHVEAGLRTGDMNQPWPEEMHRRVADLVAEIKCAPTERSAENLLREGADPKTVHVTGNTVVDALHYVLRKEHAQDAHATPGRVVLVTAHRRENFGEPMIEIGEAVARLAAKFTDVTFITPLHPNPSAGAVLRERLANLKNVQLAEPMDYPSLVRVLGRAELVLTDSGGVQEEAVSLGKPVLVMRETTERPEGVEAGWAELVGTDVNRITARGEAILAGEKKEAKSAANPYGDGRAGERIVDLMLQLPARGDR